MNFTKLKVSEIKVYGNFGSGLRNTIILLIAVKV